MGNIKEVYTKILKSADKVIVATCFADDSTNGMVEGEKAILVYKGDEIIQFLPPRLEEYTGEKLEEYKEFYNEVINR